jgi:amidase
MARTIDDVMRLLSVMAGADPEDPNAHPVPLGSLDDVTADAFVAVQPDEGTSATRRRHLRVGWFEDDGRAPVAPEIREAVRAAAHALREAGVDVVPVCPAWLEEARVLWWEIFGRASRLLLEPAVMERQDDVHPNLLQFLEWTRRMPALTAERLLEVEIERDRLRARVLAEMADTPVLLCPVSAVTAFRHGEREWHIEDQRIHYLDAWSYTAWFNLLQNPAVSVPAGVTRDGLPVGVQIVARHWEEHVALGVARLIEQRLGGYVPPPI